ncbi:hypothetical protein [Loigolactobacillus rennini]|uniref:AP2/ERF domain-containing protein n=1 Tax=Loigolactobacillus rennini DSM 20253 TaxID=1423796 RepID=A0A0R2CYB7_9LACO|nr:hypothetical protein [Loigolactobacillus rennini]KRM92774.1 hypothetical protein FC24_GL000941 [Loigolactobacillus rennini DSM 20253]
MARLDHNGNPLPVGVNERRTKTGKYRYHALVSIKGKMQRVGTYDTVAEAKKQRELFLKAAIPNGAQKAWRRDLTGKQFGHARVLHNTQYRDVDGSILWQLLCDCGTYFLASTPNLITGKVVSCGHGRKELAPEMLSHIDDLRKHHTAADLLQRKKPKTNRSGYKNIAIVTLKSKDIRYLVQLTVAGKCYYIGRFKTLSEAKAALKQARLKYVKPKLEQLKNKSK